jgi:cell division protein FtsB
VSPGTTPFDLRPLATDDAEAPRLRGASRSAVADEPPAVDVRRPVRVARGINALLVVLCLLGSIQAAGLIAVELRRLVYAEAEIARLESELEAIRRETADLRAVAERMADERYRELLARRQGYVYPDETRYVGPPP